MMAVKLRCPDCRTAFPWDTTQKRPRYCPECGYDTGAERADDDIVAPSLRSLRTAAADKVYRDMERGSEVRAQAAADMAGVPVAEMSSLKITNLRDNTGPGSVMAVPVNNPVSQAMAAQPQSFGHQSIGAQHAARVRAGPPPVDRMRTQENVKSMHEHMTRLHVDRARVNKS